MTDVRITQCPKCETTFRVTPAQLKVAKGAVRCGACLNVFKASDHFQERTSSVPAKQDDRTSDMFGESEVTKVAASKSNSQARTPKKTASAIEPSTVEAISEAALPESDYDVIHDDMDEQLIDDDKDLLIDDESGLELIDDGDEEESNFANDLNEEFLSLDANNQTSDPFYADGDLVIQDIESTEDDDESWAEALLNEDETAPDSEIAQKIEPQAIFGDISSDSEPVHVQTVETNTHEMTAADAALDKALSEAADLASFDAPPTPASTPASQFQYIQADPLELNLPDRNALRMRWVWLGLSLLASILLCVQLAYFHFEQWARDPKLRPWYEIACHQLNCTLPPIYDLKQIRTTATPRVNTHPSFENALSVDILFMNHAKYEQPFPILQLSFTDKQGNLVAQRAFQSVEYLAGEAAGMEMMPSLIPIHIALEIQDPGPSADNYQVSFLSPP